jgi:hypothetical protein
MKRQLVADEWDTFAKTVLPNDVSDVQRSEMRLAFYAGAIALFYKLQKAVGPGGDVTADDMRIMMDLENELREFAREMERKARNAN